MKKIIIVIFISLLSQVSNSQTYKFKATGFSVSEKTKKGWSEWTKTQPTELLINLDRDKNRFVVYSEILQLYSIYKYEDRVETATDFSNKYYCVDNDGLDTVITVVTPKDKTTLKQIYIANDEMMIQYDLIYLGENK